MSKSNQTPTITEHTNDTLTNETINTLLQNGIFEGIRREEIKFFLRLHGLWEGIVMLPRPPPPPFDIETMEPIEPPWLAIKEWIPDDEPYLDWFNRPRNPNEPDPDWFEQTPKWKAPEIHLDDGRILVLEYT